MPKGDLYAILSGFFWSFSVIFMRISGFQIPAIPLTFFKSGVSILLFLALTLFMGDSLMPSLSSEAYVRLVASAVLGISIADTMFAAALNRLGASLQALTDCVYAPSVAGVGFLMFGEVLGVGEWIGGALVVTGVIIGLGMTPEVKSPRDLIIGVLLASGAHIIMAVGILMVRDIYQDHSVVWVSGFRFLVATLILGIIAWPKTGSRLFVGFVRRDTWKYMIPMTFFGPFLATICWVSGFKYLPAGRAAIYNQLSTVFIIIMAVIFLKEELTMKKSLGVIVAVIGSVVVSMSG